MDVLKELNKIVFEERIASRENLKDIMFENNILKFNGRELSLNNFNLSSLFSNYSELMQNIDFIDAQDLFSIVMIHVMVNNDLASKQSTFYDYINSSNGLMENQKKYVDDFNTILFEMLKYRDYLLSNALNILMRFEITMENLRINGNLNQNQLQELSLYDEIKEQALRFQNENEKKKTPKRIARNLTKMGYVNITLMSGFIILLGITIAFCFIVNFR